MRIIVTGGGTGGHVYPAIALANKFRDIGHEILYVGVKGRVEEKIAPENGYRLKTLWISGFQRGEVLANLLLPFKIITSFFQALLILLTFRPQIVIGTGGYVSAPMLFVASFFRIKTIIQEQNSYPGITNRWLQKRVDEIHIAYEECRKYFPKAKKVKLSGNPVRFKKTEILKNELRKKFDFDNKLTVSIIGGSLGALSINKAIASILKNSKIFENVNLIWQTGEKTFSEFFVYSNKNHMVKPYFKNMDEVYGVSDLIICRAGAMTLAEVTISGISSILVPYKFATGNHQYYNAKAISDNGAGFLAEDKNNLCNQIQDFLQILLTNPEKLKLMSEKAESLSFSNATDVIVASALDNS
jgi:UDP-N-acetylglucosamine--N-acetylmuramyl-(pentapeptide) pyrophosphoryl-undecaprenol N-acetylglucosamine transferase